MDTTITKASPVEYELDIHATAEDLKPKLKEALKAQRKTWTYRASARARRRWAS